MSLELNSKIPAGPLETKWQRHKDSIKLVNPANKRKHSIIVVGTGLAGAAAGAGVVAATARAGVVAGAGVIVAAGSTD